MANLSPAQIESLAYQAGFRGDAIRWITAIALAESGGNPAAYNPETAAGTRPGAGSYGLTQIYSTAHPEFNRQQLFNPLYNLQAAFRVFQQAGNRFTPWSTYNIGSAQHYLSSVPSAVPSTSAAAGGSYSSALSSLAAGSMSQALPGSYLNAVSPGVIVVTPQVQTTGQATGGTSPGGAAGSILPTINIQPPTLTSFLGAEPVNIGFALGGALLVIIGVIVLFAVIVKSAEPSIRQGIETGRNVAKTAATVAAVA